MLGVYVQGAIACGNKRNGEWRFFASFALEAIACLPGF